MRAQTWLERLAHELTVRGFGPDRIASIVVEAQGHLEETGEPPLTTFGDPETYALDLASALEQQAAPRAAGEQLRVRATGVCKAYGRRRVLRDVSLEAYGGQVVVLIGPNGCGKSTLLQVLAGLVSRDAGEVELAGSLGYAPQQGGVVPHLRPAEQLELFGHARGLSRRSAIREGERIARELGWSTVGAPIASRLSGGTRQKLNVVLATLGDPDVLLLDEPCQGLDRDSTERFWALLASWREAGRTVIVVSHAPEAVRHADEVIELAPVQARAS